MKTLQYLVHHQKGKVPPQTVFVSVPGEIGNEEAFADYIGSRLADFYEESISQVDPEEVVCPFQRLQEYHSALFNILESAEVINGFPEHALKLARRCLERGPSCQ